MSDGIDHEAYTMAAIHERDGCPDGEECRWCIPSDERLEGARENINTWRSLAARRKAMLEDLKRERDELRRKVARYRHYWHETVKDYGVLHQLVMAGDFDGARAEAERHTVHLAAEPHDGGTVTPPTAGTE